MFYFFIALLFAYIVFAKEENILLLFVFLLPFHSFLKAFSDFYFKQGAGDIFSIWKEFAVIVFAGKVFIKHSLFIDRSLQLCLYLFIFVILLFFAFSDDYSNAFAHLRDHVFTIILFLSIASFPVTLKLIKRIFYTFLIAGFITGVTGFLEYYLYKIPIGFIMKTIDFIDASGYIQYNYNSFRIMGIERMSGILTGPNDFGLYCAVVVVVGIFMLNVKHMFPKYIYWATLGVVMLCGICLVLSFSRAGWVIVIVALLFMIYKKLIRIKAKTIFLLGVIGVVMVLTIGIVFPSTLDILSNTFSGKEASASTRQSELTEGLGIVANEPFGHGLGTAEIRSSTKSFFVESAFINISYEIGITGLALLVFNHLFIIRLLYKRINQNLLIVFTVGLSIASVITAFASINPYGMPYIYIWWFFIGLGMNRNVEVFNETIAEPSETAVIRL